MNKGLNVIVCMRIVIFSTTKILQPVLLLLYTDLLSVSRTWQLHDTDLHSASRSKSLLELTYYRAACGAVGRASSHPQRSKAAVAIHDTAAARLPFHWGHGADAELSAGVQPLESLVETT